jgi:Probable transposase
MCSRAGTRRSRRSSAGCNAARKRASRASRGALATATTPLHSTPLHSTPSGSRRSATAHGWIRVRLSSPRSGVCMGSIGRAPPHSGPPQDQPVTISQEAAGWYRSLSCAEVPTHPWPPTGRETGIDLGLEAFATLADGTMSHTPRCYRTAEASLAKCQRRVSQRKKGSARRRKAGCGLGKAHQTAFRRQRQDFQHKAALSLVRGYNTRAHEDVQTANRVQHHHLAKAIADAGWSAFLAILCHPFRQSCACWSGSVRGEPCVHEPSLLGLRRGRAARRVRPLAPVPVRSAARACTATTTPP